MKPTLFFLLWVAITAFSPDANAQTVATTPGEHMDYFIQKETELSKKYMSYMSEIAHGGKARKMEKRREDVVLSLRETIREANKLRPYKGDASLRDAYKDFWNVLLSLFTEDYHRIVDMEEVAERSYDAMEAYLLTQELANEKLEDANTKVRTAYNAFAASNNITLTEGQTSKLNKKLNQAGQVSKYTNQIFLISFKSSVQESEMIEALNRKDINAVEQTKNSMLKFSEEGLLKLDSIKPFKGDGSLANACRKVLEFQKQEAGKMDVIIDFLIKSDELDKMKKSYESKPAAKRTKEDVDAFNKAIENFNKSVEQYNKVNNELNAGRTRVRTHYDTTKKRFMDHHVPRA